MLLGYDIPELDQVIVILALLEVSVPLGFMDRLQWSQPFPCSFFHIPINYLVKEVFYPTVKVKEWRLPDSR